MYIATFGNSKSIFLVENQFKMLQSVTRDGRIDYKGNHGYIDIYVDKHNIIRSILHGLENSPKKDILG